MQQNGYMQAFARASKVLSELQSTVETVPLMYTAVLARSCTKHIYTGKNLTPAQSIAMHTELQKCSKVVVAIYYDGSALLSGAVRHSHSYVPAAHIEVMNATESVADFRC